MSVRSDGAAQGVALQPLTRPEIDRRLDDVVAQVAAGADALKSLEVESLRPRPISAAELVRRMRPFLSWN